MKKIISILLFACAGALAACDFLDVVPEGQATQEDIFKTSKEARKYLNTLYTYAPNIAAYRYMPDFCAGDDIITATNGQTRYFPYKSMLYNEENASQTYYGLWDATTSSPSGRTNYDMYKGIRYCYIMIDNIDAVPGISPSVADEFKGEAYFLIAYYHWVLLTHYGPVILVRGQLDMGLPEEQVYVARSPFDECVTFIAETYDRAADLLHGYPTRPDADLGRATSVAAKAMKARLLLYAASPLCNGNTEFYARFRNNDGTPLMSQTYNPEKWKWALDACQEAITLAEDNGHRLYESPNATAAATAAERGEINYHDCFVEPLWNTAEYLWAMGDQTGIEHLQRYGGARLKLPYSTDGFCINIVPTFECVEMYYTHNGLPWDRDPETMHIDPYAYNAEKETANLHVYKEPRFYASVGYDRGKYAINGEEFILKCRAGEMQGSVLDASKEYQSCTGYILKKWIHRQSAFNYDTKSWTYRKYAYPYIRLAELYLSYAEADFEYNGSLSDASQLPESGPPPLGAARFQGFVGLGRGHSHRRRTAQGAAPGAFDRTADGGHALPRPAPLERGGRSDVPASQGVEPRRQDGGRFLPGLHDEGERRPHVRIPQDLLDGHSVERNQYQLQPRAESRLLTLIIRLR